MASGFFALLDDIAVIAKTAAASLDDVAAQSANVVKKTTGIVIDDTAVTPRYVVGFAAERELPIIGRIAWGSIKNKLVFLLPAALVLSAFAPWLITPLLMVGGLFLCFEGYEKVHGMLHPHATAAAATIGTGPAGPEAVLTEDDKVASAVRTDFILSAEIMAIALATTTDPSLWTKAVVLFVVAILVTVGVYGTVALIVKADDVGLHLAQKGLTAFTRRLGTGLVGAVPGVLKVLSFVGMLAMLWVGGGIILHGLEGYGFGTVPHAFHAIAKWVGGLLGPLSGIGTWAVDATLAGIVGLVLGYLAAKGLELRSRVL
jgi:hypothetical protein